MNKYKIVKLKSGESLICKLLKVKDKTIILERPMVFKSLPLPPNPLLIGAEGLIIKNWLEFSTDTSVEIAIDHIAALITPDRMLSSCYEIELEKEENPIIKQQALDKMKKEMEELQQNIAKLSINFNIPEDMVPDVLGALGINMQMQDEFDVNAFEDIEPLLPQKQKKKKKNEPNKSRPNKEDNKNWGNDWKDWSIDPHDYT